MSERRASHDRDIVRPEWQRSVGALVFMQASDQLFGDGDIALPPQNLLAGEVHRAAVEDRRQPFWYELHAGLAHILHMRMPGKQFDESLPPDVKQGFYENTHFQRPGIVLAEGINAQVGFTLNMAQLISQTADRRNVSGFEASTYPQVANLLRRDSFIKMIDAAAFVHNGFWGEFSTAPSLPRVGEWEEVGSFHPLGRARWLTQFILFENDDVGFMPGFDDVLRSALRDMNRNATNSSPTSYRASSGCPARHLRPQLKVGDDVNQLGLKAAMDLYDLTYEELIVPRKTSPITDGIRFMADIVERFDDYQNGKLTSYQKAQVRTEATSTD